MVLGLNDSYLSINKRATLVLRSASDTLTFESPPRSIYDYLAPVSGHLSDKYIRVSRELVYARQATISESTTRPAACALRLSTEGLDFKYILVGYLYFSLVFFGLDIQNSC